jgi:hypothetical protein
LLRKLPPVAGRIQGAPATSGYWLKSGNIMDRKKKFWICLSLVNLFLVAVVGFILRSKIVFSIPFIDYRNFLSAHSHFAFSGWAGLCIMTLFVYNLLPVELSQKRIYQWALWLVQITSLGMLFSFPFKGYGLAAIVFSTSYIFATYFFAWVFIRDIVHQKVNRATRMLSIIALVSLVLSSIGPFTLAYMMSTNSTDSVLYRGSIYSFLHFQYNGFFTLGVFALLFQHMVRKGIELPGSIYRFALILSLSVLPSLFLSLLWHEDTSDYVLGALGAFLIIWAAFLFFRFILRKPVVAVFSKPIAHWLWIFCLVSFAGKIIMQTGTLIPSLGHAIYSDRPVIIGFLHLIFLGFLTFFLLAYLTEEGIFSKGLKTSRFPLVLFSAGIIANEALLLLQGLEILFKTSNYIYNWLLWGAAIILASGAFSMAVQAILITRQQKSHSLT